MGTTGRQSGVFSLIKVLLSERLFPYLPLITCNTETQDVKNENDTALPPS